MGRVRGPKIGQTYTDLDTLQFAFNWSRLRPSLFADGQIPDSRLTPRAKSAFKPGGDALTHGPRVGCGQDSNSSTDSQGGVDGRISRIAAHRICTKILSADTGGHRSLYLSRGNDTGLNPVEDARILARSIALPRLAGSLLATTRSLIVRTCVQSRRCRCEVPQHGATDRSRPRAQTVEQRDLAGFERRRSDRRETLARTAATRGACRSNRAR